MNIFLFLLQSMALAVVGSGIHYTYEQVFGAPEFSTRTGQINQNTEVVNCDVKSGKVDNCIEWGRCSGTKPAKRRDVEYKRQQVEMCGTDKECCSSSLYNPDDPLGEECGVRLPSGLAKTFGQFPWMVAILRTMNTNASLYYTYIGGGSIINPRTVLTAANINLQMDPEHVESVWVRAGEWDLHSNSEYPPHQDRGVTHIVRHQNFILKTLQNNVALLILKEPFVQAGNVQMVCIPLPTYVETDGTNCFASSWDSKTMILKKVVQPVVDRKACTRYLHETQSTIDQLHNSVMCAGGRADTNDCEVDIGSPLVCSVNDDPNRYIQIGILGRSLECNGSTPSIYTALTSLRQWIDNALMPFNINSVSYTYTFKQRV